MLRNIITVGEAASNVPEAVIAKHPGLPWKEMRAIRNIVVHEYFGVDNRIVWDTLKNNLSPLLPMLKNLIQLDA